MEDVKEKRGKRKNSTRRPWWVWGMMGLAALGILIAAGQSLDILPDRRDAAATLTAERRSTLTSLETMRRRSTPEPTSVIPTIRFPRTKTPGTPDFWPTLQADLVSTRSAISE